MLQSLMQFCIALLDLLEQAHILYRDDRLVGEDFEESNLLVSERTDFGATNHDCSDRNIFTKQWRSKDSPSARKAEKLRSLRKFDFRLCRDVLDVNRLPVD